MSGLRILYTDLSRQYNKIQLEIIAAQNTVYSSGRVLDGEYTLKFEVEMAKRCERKYAVAVNSCTQALLFANIMTCRDNPNVVIPAVSFVATANSVIMSGRHPHFVDVDNQGLIDVKNFKECDADTLIFVDLYGNIPNPSKLATPENWLIIEDAAQSFGAYYDGRPAGTFGHISCLSFDPMKNLPNYGSGGMILTDDEYFYTAARNLRDNGKLSRVCGTNSKMSESDCASMLVKLKHFDDWQKRRKAIASYYNTTIKDRVQIPTISSRVSPSWHKYVIQTNDRELLQSHLKERGIETKIHYSTPLCNLPGARELCSRVLSLPIYPELTDDEVEEIAQSVVDF